MIYGDSGSGKTRLLGTGDKDSRWAPMLLLDLEGGTSSLVGSENIEVARIKGIKDFNEIYTYLQSDEARKQFRTVALDSLSETHIRTLHEIVEGEEKSGKRPPDQVELQDYNKALVRMRRLVMKFRDLPFNFICTALPKTTETTRGALIVPNFPGSFTSEVAGYFDWVGRLSTLIKIDGNVKRSVRTLDCSGTQGAVGKFRQGPMGEQLSVFENPSLPKILDLRDKVKTQVETT